MPKLFVLAVVLLPFAGCGGSKSPTQPTPLPVEVSSTLNSAFDSFMTDLGPAAACSLSVWRGGTPVIERGSGPIAPGRTADADSLYRVGSVTKPFTAAAVLMLERSGRLRRTDRLSAVLPGQSEPSPSLEDLIRHVPGMPSFTDSAEYYLGGTSPISLTSLLALIPPWDGVRRMTYSNAHYTLLGTAVAQASGTTYEEFVRREIFAPLQMIRSSFDIPSASESVSYPSPSLTHPTWAYAAGSITSTARDVSRFNHALLNGSLGFDAIAGFERTAAANGFTTIAMEAATLNGETYFRHGGAIEGGYSAMTAVFPGDRSSVALLCNVINPPALFHFLVRPQGIRAAMLGS